MRENNNNCYIHTLYSLFSIEKYCSDLRFVTFNSATLSEVGLSTRYLCHGKYGMYSSGNSRVSQAKIILLHTK